MVQGINAGRLVQAQCRYAIELIVLAALSMGLSVANSSACINLCNDM